MTQDDLFYRAVQRRDARFDGRFFTAVVTTGIYCRPVCPARTPLRRNVRFFDTAQAAQAAGFRPCLRCRPESGPGSAAWSGTQAMLRRALRLLAQAPPGEGVPALAAKLGVGDRQLRRLFGDRLGTTPAAALATARLRRAHALLRGASRPMGEVCALAGFSSVRAFNDAVRAEFGCAPTALRRAGGEVPRPCFELRLRATAPFDFEAALAFYAARELAGIEAVEAGRYGRSFRFGAQRGAFTLSRSADGAVAVAVDADAAALPVVAGGVRRMLDLDADMAAVHSALARSPAVATLARTRPGLRLWGGFDPFETAVRIVLAQQVSTAAARTLGGRLVARHGDPLPRPLGRVTHAFPEPSALVAFDGAGLGMPAARARAVRSIASFAAEGGLAPGTPFAALRERLCALEGVGPWTAECIALRAFADPDALPDTDLALRSAARLPSNAGSLRQSLEPCRPFRGYAAVHLWTAAA